MVEKGCFNLTNPQKSIWNMEKYFEGTTINNICTIGIINEKIDEKLIVKALNNVVKKNDAFRINIKLEAGEPIQYIREFANFDVDIIHIKSEQELKDVENESANHIFNVINSNLFYFKVAIFDNGYGAVILTVNHLIADSWSLGLVIQNILKEYHNVIEGIELPENNSYVDYIKSEEEYKKSNRYEIDKNYWEKIYETIPEPVSFPENQKKNKYVSSDSKREKFILNTKFSDKIKTYCSQNGITVFNFFMAIYSIYLNRVSGKDDFVIGTPILNRLNFKEKQTMGMFVNTIPARISIPDVPTKFIEFASINSTKMIGYIKHQKYSYTQILEDLRTKNNKISNLYDILISYQITKAFKQEYGNYKTDWIFNNHCSNDFNIHITDINDTGNLNISYDYLIDRYNDKYVEKVHNRILYMINQVLENTEISLKEIEIVTREEKDKLLNVFNNINVNYPKDKTIVDLFETQVSKTPNNIAIAFEDKKMTYKELNEKANSLANYLISKGVKQKEIIGLRLNKSLEMIIGIIAIIKAGCCYLPINMQYPKDRVEYMLKDSKAQLLLGTKESLDEFDIKIEKIDISLAEEKIYNQKKQNLKLKISPEDLLYIIYTSGSTGKPKGAMICHKNVVRLMKNDKFLFDFNENDVWTMFHSVAFDFSVWEMYGALLYGGKLVIVPEYIAKDPNLYLELMEKEKVTVLNQTPTYFYNLLNCEAKRPHKNLMIRYIVFGGEALKPNMLKPWRKLHPKTKLINMYGITETTVHVTFKELNNKDLESPKSNIGLPIPTLGIILLDKNLKLVPPGVPGEICVCGDGVFKGYLNRDDLNKTKLIKNPYSENEIMYRSADSGICGDDYVLEYLGRIDKQVKIRGFRVELGEIEEKIKNFQGINSCIVTTKKSIDEHDLLCAYYICDSQIELDKLKNKLKKDLPNYMIPQYFIEVEKWPFNFNGKIDVKKLPVPQYQAIEMDIIPPRNETDLKLIELLKVILSTENISIDNNFFDLGGDSLSAIILCMQIQDKFKVQLYVKDIIDNPVIKDISDLIQESKK